MCPHSMCNKNMLMKTCNVYKKCNSHTEIRYLALFTKYITNITYIFINKQTISFQNCFGLLSRLCQGKGCKSFPHFKCLSILLRRQKNDVLGVRVEDSWTIISKGKVQKLTMNLLRCSKNST